jgi:MEMO1 family protein
MDIKVDEEEHSLENQLPWIARAMEGHDFSLVPIMVGSLSEER